MGAWGRHAEGNVRAANHLQAHRGPDDQGHFFDVDAQVALGHVRLSILDLSPLGHQPMLSDDKSVVLVFNGEIYNFRELRASLEAGGTRFRGQSDSEVLLALYLRHGESMLSMLNGIFAFAFWDRRHRELLLVRDAAGVKPLYYAESRTGSHFAFASEIKALLPLLTDRPELDTMSLHRYLSFLWCPGAGTPLKGIRKLLPGELIAVKDGRVVRRQQWRELPAFNSQPNSLDEKAAILGTATALRTAVHRQMVADVPVGAFLSGGLDSSAVVAMAREVSPHIDCFTIDTGAIRDAGVTDDLPYARQVAKHLGVKLHEIHVDSSRMAADLERMVFQLDEPLADPAPLNVLYISELARQHGVKVLLSGAGGDDLFTGYRRHRALILERYWAWLPLPARAGLRHLSSHVSWGGAWSRRVTKAFAQADWPAEKRLAGYFLWADPHRVLGLFTSEHRVALASEAMTAPMEDFLGTLPVDLPPLQRMLALEQRFFLADHNLLYTDKMSMAAGVEVRVPFLDNDLVQLANSLPPELKQRGRVGKWVLKKAMEPYLPHNVIYRPKTGFGAPLRHWLRHELRELVDDMLSADTLRRRGLFDAKAVANLVADDRAGRVDAAYTILGLVCIEIWCRKFLDETTSTRPHN